jgi:hypothetical protein
LAYIGNIPAESYASFETETFSVSATTNYTLSYAVTNENEIRLVINGVVQQPGSGKAYTASGVNLVLSSATVSGDVMYAVYLGRALQTVNPPNASVGSAQIADSLISGKTALGATPADTDELLISDAGTLKRVDYSHLKSANTPAFYASKSSGQSVADSTNTKVTFETELFDSDGKYDASASRFTPTVAGHYLVSSTLSFTNHPAGKYCQIRIVKNGADVFSEFNQNQFASSDADTKTTATFMIYLDADDYLEIFIRHNAGQNETTRSGNECRFMAQKIIGA